MRVPMYPSPTHHPLRKYCLVAHNVPFTQIPFCGRLKTRTFTVRTPSAATIRRPGLSYCRPLAQNTNFDARVRVDGLLPRYLVACLLTACLFACTLPACLLVACLLVCVVMHFDRWLGFFFALPALRVCLAARLCSHYLLLDLLPLRFFLLASLFPS